MQYREFEKTGFKDSIIGLGCGFLGNSSKTKQPLEIVKNALEYRVNYLTPLMLTLAMRPFWVKAWVLIEEGFSSSQKP